MRNSHNLGLNLTHAIFFYYVLNKLNVENIVKTALYSNVLALLYFWKRNFLQNIMNLEF